MTRSAAAATRRGGSGRLAVALALLSALAAPATEAPAGQEPRGRATEPRSPDRQSPDGQSPDGQSPDGQGPDGQGPDRRGPNRQDPDRQDPDRQNPVLSLTVVAPQAGRVAWAPRGDWIAYDRVDDDGYTRLYIARPDGFDRRCLTCDPLEFRRLHTGNPTWHPSGDYLVFEAEKPFRRAGAPEPFLRVPGRNLGSDLWAISFNGRTFYRLTSHMERGAGRVHSPRFSHEGDQLVWAEREAAGGGGWGGWVLRVAKIRSRRGVPRLRNVRAHRIGRGHHYYEPYDFTTDDRGLLLASERPPAGPDAGLDLFVLRLDEGGEAIRLTGGAASVNRFASLAPNGRWVAWATDRDLPRARPGSTTALDLWMMRTDGFDARRLTWFNDVFSEGYLGPTAVRSAAWSPEGDRLLILVTTALGQTTSGELQLLQLDRAYGR